jgi:hypothetical protein
MDYKSFTIVSVVRPSKGVFSLAEIMQRIERGDILVRYNK